MKIVFLWLWITYSRLYDSETSEWKNPRFWALNLGWLLSSTTIVILSEGFDSLDLSYFSRYLDEFYNWADISAALNSSLMKTRNISSNENCAKLFINVDLNVARLMFESNNELMIVMLDFVKIEFFINFWVN